MTPKPKRIQLRRARGWRLPDGAKSVARPHGWGNPFIVGTDGTAAECVAKYREWIVKQDRDFSELRGKDLACWCKPGAPCHADVLIELANDHTRGNRQ